MQCSATEEITKPNFEWLNVWRSDILLCVFYKVKQYVMYAVRSRQLETRTWLWVDCRNQTLDNTSLRSAVWQSIISSESIVLCYKVVLNTDERSAVWLLIFWIKYHASRFVIVLPICSNCALEYTPDRVLQASFLRLAVDHHEELPIGLCPRTKAVRRC